MRRDGKMLKLRRGASSKLPKLRNVSKREATSTSRKRETAQISTTWALFSYAVVIRTSGKERKRRTKDNYEFRRKEEVKKTKHSWQSNHGATTPMYNATYVFF